MTPATAVLFVRARGPWHIAKTPATAPLRAECGRKVTGEVTRYRSNRTPTGAFCPVCAKKRGLS